MTQKAPAFPAASILGYPRIGPNRELKTAVEAYWAGKIDQSTLENRAAELRAQTLSRLQELGLPAGDSSIPLDFTYYDQMLQAAVTLDAVPERFDYLRRGGEFNGPAVDLAGYFTMARGVGDLPPLEMTKWFDSNYHYLVPEISPDTQFRYRNQELAEQVAQASGRGVTGRPVVVGPVTFLLLSKAADGAPAGFQPLHKLEELLGAYADWLRDLGRAGAQWVQLDEPGLVVDTWNIPRAEILAALEHVYQVLGEALADGPAMFVSLAYGSAYDAAEVLAKTPVAAIGLDLVRGQMPASSDLTELAPRLAGKTVVAGVVSGRNIWRANLDEALEKIETLKSALGSDVTVAVGTSTSLFHVPHDVYREEAIDRDIRSWLAFADQKVGEVAVLARASEESWFAVSRYFAAERGARANRHAHPGVRVEEIRRRVAAVTDADRARVPYAERKPLQDAALGLPLLPTTTIGSFPQTADIRRARAAHRQNNMSDAEYQAAMQAEIKGVVELQEELGLDVLVHGEAERNDMVQYFAELLDGFIATQHGWVQSYGSRCTRPAILWGDVSRRAPMTVQWASYAQSLTAKPMKGMLTGPVTIMAWSFVRDDIPAGQTADQLALALREEIADLQDAGIKVIQVDEPALRELLPLRASEQEEYLNWSVGAFKLATGGAAPQTQVHTHLCYSEFNVIISAIDRLDADVTSIEASRSRMEILPAVGQHGFERQLGPGVWDIHSPRVPSAEECTQLVRAAVDGIGADKVWVNPDCGLKTRGYEETIASLTNLVAAAHTVRGEV